MQKSTLKFEIESFFHRMKIYLDEKTIGFITEFNFIWSPNPMESEIKIGQDVPIASSQEGCFYIEKRRATVHTIQDLKDFFTRNQKDIDEYLKIKPTIHFANHE